MSYNMQTIIEVVCSSCKTKLGEKDGNGMSGISHSICEKCIREKYKDEFSEEEMQEILEGGD